MIINWIKKRNICEICGNPRDAFMWTGLTGIDPRDGIKKNLCQACVDIIIRKEKERKEKLRSKLIEHSEKVWEEMDLEAEKKCQQQ